MSNWRRLSPTIAAQICGGVGDPAVAAAALGCIGTGLGCAVAVFRLCRRWLDDQDGTLANRLLSGAGGMDSAESALDLWRLADWARKEPAVARVLREPDGFAAAREQLERTPNGREFLASWETFMTRHGHHAQGEMDVHNPRWLEKPDYILNLVRGYLRMSEDNDPLKLQAEKSASAAGTVGRMSKASPKSAEAMARRLPGAQGSARSRGA